MDGNEWITITWKADEWVDTLATSSWQFPSLIDIDAGLLSFIGASVAYHTTQAFRIGLDHPFQRIATIVRRVTGSIKVV